MNNCRITRLWEAVAQEKTGNGMNICCLKRRGKEPVALYKSKRHLYNSPKERHGFSKERHKSKRGICLSSGDSPISEGESPNSPEELPGSPEELADSSEELGNFFFPTVKPNPTDPPFPADFSTRNPTFSQNAARLAHRCPTDYVHFSHWRRRIHRLGDG